jgi:hypothetical protein
MEVLPGNIAVVLSAVLVGVAFGYVLQRGRYCVNTAFRDIIFINDLTLFRAYVLSVVVAIIGANLFEDMGWLGSWTDPETGEVIPNTLGRQAFAPVANILGGYLFGLGMVLAGGCGSGILYRVGEGLVAALVAVMGFAAGILMTLKGLLRPLYLWLRSYKVSIGTDEWGDPIYSFGLHDLFGGSVAAKWVIIAIITVAAGVFLLKGQPFQKGSGKGYKWSVAGLLIGILAVVGWWASGVWGQDPRGISFTGPLGELSLALLTGNSDSARQMFDFFGYKVTWSALLIVGVPVGSYLSARALKEFALKAPDAKELLTVFGGGLLMGFGAATGGG